MRRAILALLLALAPSVAAAQGLPSANQVYAGPTTGSPSAPSFRALVPADVPAAALPNGQIFIGNASNLAVAQSLSGDCTVTNVGVLTCSIPNAHLSNFAAAGVKGATAAGPVADLTTTQLTTLCNVFTSTLSGCVPGSGGGTTNFLRADGTWAAPAGGGGTGTLVSIVTYSSSQTITIPATATKAFIRMTGGSGGSGGTATACGTSGCSTGATGAPGYLEKYLTGLTAGNTLAFTQGAAGTAGANTGTAGGNGTASTLASGTQVITTLTANGSNGSTGATVDGTSTNMTVGGTATNGDVNVTGAGVAAAVGIAIPNAFTNGANGLSFATGARTGNVGNAGVMIIMWFTWNLTPTNDNEPMRLVA